MTITSPLRKYGDFIEKALFISLSGLAISSFCSEWGISRFSMWSVYILLIWRFLIRYEPVRTLPKWLLLFTALYLLSFAISSLVSDDKTKVVPGLKDLRVIFLAGLLYTAPLSDKLRKYIITMFFISAIIGSLIGISQYFGLFQQAIYDRAYGLPQNPTIYATQLAFACGAGILIFVFKESDLFKAKRELYLLLITITATLLAILYSQSRGVWIALLAAYLVPLFIYNHQKAVKFLIISIAALILVFVLSRHLEQRAVSIPTSIIHPEISASNSISVRLELWKGALLIFRESPLFGTGIGDFKRDMVRLIETKKIDPICKEASGASAHSSYFHTLATQGLFGIVSLLGLYSALIIFAAQNIKFSGGIGGYIILSITIVLLVAGLVDSYVPGIGMRLILTEYCFIFGLLGPYGLKKGELEPHNNFKKSTT